MQFETQNNKGMRLAVLLFCFLHITVLFGKAMAKNNIPIPADRPKEHHFISGTAITLADAIFMGLRENRTIKSAYISRVIQKFDLNVINNSFKPRLAVSGSIVRQNQNGGRGSTSIDVSPGVRVKTTSGARFEFAWVNNAAIADTVNSFSSVAELNFEQPLLRGGGTEVNLAPIKRARLAEQANQQKLKSTIAEVIATIIFAHRDLLLAQEESKLGSAAMQRAEELLAINLALIKPGRMAAVEAVQSEADLENQRLKVLQSKQSVEAAKLVLLNLLALKLDTHIVASEKLLPKKVQLNTQKLLSVALVMRPDYLFQLYSIKQNRLGLRVAKNEKLWDINLFARGRFGIETARHQSNRTIADTTIGLRFTIPLNDPAPEQDILNSSTNLRLANLRLLEIKQGIELQIRGSVNETQILWEQLNVAEKALKLAREVVDIEKAKLKAGRSSNIQVRLQEDRLRDIENQLLRARVGYFNALTRLDLQLGTTLDTWQIDLNNGGF